MFTPKFKLIKDSVLSIVQNANSAYALAHPLMTQYLGMKLVIFGVDDHHLLAIAFPVFITVFNRESLAHYEMETVSVPNYNFNEAANTYSTVTISKPYMTINDGYYVWLCIYELCMCKHINYEYICKELFLVKHSPKIAGKV